MADSLREELDIEAQMIPGHGGIFVVSVDDVPVARKTSNGFPTPEQCVVAVRQALAG